MISIELCIIQAHRDTIVTLVLRQVTLKPLAKKDMEKKALSYCISLFRVMFQQVSYDKVHTMLTKVK